jgi:hypothetical protein
VEQESKQFTELLEHANSLIERDEKKNEIQAKMLKLHRLEWGENLWSKPENIRETRDTHPWDAVRTSVDILSVHEPTITIELPREEPEAEPVAPMGMPPVDPMLGGMDEMGMGMPDMGMDPMAEMEGIAGAAFGEELASTPTIEGMAGAAPEGDEYNPTEIGETLEGVVRKSLQDNDQRRKSPLLRDFLVSTFVFDEIVAKVADMRMSPQWDKQPARLKRMSPFKINACLPMTVHAEWDDFGLAGVLHRYKRSLREVQRDYGNVSELVKTFEGDPEGNVIFCEWWTRDEMCQWIEKSGVKHTEKQEYGEKTENDLLITPLKPHDYGFVPYVIATGSGSGMFDGTEEQIAPLLYGGWKSNTFYRSNLFLSIAASLAFAESNPKWVYGSETGEKTFDLNFNFPEVIPTKTGETVDRLEVGVNEDVYKMLQEFTSRSERTTISTVAAGQVPAGVSAAAAINLLVQGTKLTIVPAQNAVGKVYSGIAHMLFDYIKAYGESDVKIMLRQSVQAIDPAKIPDWVDVKVTLRADLPQDKALLYNVAVNAWKQGFISRETGWDIVGIEDKVKEQERIDTEIRDATPEEMMQGKVSAPAQAALTAEQQAQMQQQQQAEAGIGDATTNAASEGLPYEQNPQPGNAVLDQMNALQNMIANPGG